MPDLWPDDLGTPDEKPPLAILREQANLLAQKTGGAVEGLVRTEKRGDTFAHVFYLAAPSLDNYTYQLFFLAHAAEFYPATIGGTSVVEPQPFSVSSEAELAESLRRIFAADKTKRIINSLRAQAGVA